METSTSANLVTLPSELRKLIVSYLAPHPKHLRPGCKTDLKNANLTHSSLREWVPELMFRDMTLPVYVDLGISSSLELFAVSSGSIGLGRYVRHIQVQLPPALRWKNNAEQSWEDSVLDHRRRFCKRRGVRDVSELTAEERNHMSGHYRQMVEPFLDSRRWRVLFQAANNSWHRIFRYFRNLSEISVGKMRRVDHPRPSNTTDSMLYYDYTDDIVDPPYIDDWTVNQAWASSIVLTTAPTTVRTLHLSLANVDDLVPSAPVNRLLNLSYLLTPQSSKLSAITKLTLTLGGFEGTHGDRGEFGPTGSAACARHCKKMLNALTELRHLELCSDLAFDNGLGFSDFDVTRIDESILEWILPDLVLNHLRTLRLRRFQWGQWKLIPMLTGHWPLLEQLVFEECRLRRQISEDIDDSQGEKVKSRRNNSRGQSWLDNCQALSERYTGLVIELIRPWALNHLRQYHVHPDNVAKLRRIPGVMVDTRYALGVCFELPEGEKYKCDGCASRGPFMVEV